MTPGKIPGATVNLAKPKDWKDSDGECGDLWVAVDRAGPQGDQTTMRSAWHPNEEEKAAIAAGAPVVLWVWGTGHPPVAVTVGEVPKT
jgi:hypothetical protein